MVKDDDIENDQNRHLFESYDFDLWLMTLESYSKHYHYQHVCKIWVP